MLVILLNGAVSTAPAATRPELGSHIPRVEHPFVMSDAQWDELFVGTTRRQEIVSPATSAFGPSCRVAGKFCLHEGSLAPEGWGFFAECSWRRHRFLHRGSSAHWASADGWRHRQGLCEVAISSELRESGQGALVTPRDVR